MVCVCVCVFIKLRITEQSGPVILVIIGYCRPSGLLIVGNQPRTPAININRIVQKSGVRFLFRIFLLASVAESVRT